MCQHVYSSDSEKKCPFPVIYESIAKIATANKIPKKFNGFNTNLLYDDKLVCIYHSKKKDFKKENRMIDQFKLLPSIMFWARKNKFLTFDSYDFDEFIFVGQEENYEDELMQLDNNEIINLAELNFPDYTSFNNCIFYDDVWLSYCQFLKKSSFDNTKFYNSCDFSDTTFSATTSFKKSYFGDSASFRATIFNSSVYFENCVFDKSVGFNMTLFKSHASFLNSRFEKAYFNQATFLKASFGDWVTFENATFTELLRIENVEFNGEVSFLSSKFNLAELIDVKFSTDQVVTFDSIEVINKLIIKSLHNEKKIFNHIVSLNVSADKIQGEILFENTNIFFIKQTDILKDLSLPSVKKIVLGPGCDKYKLKREFTIPIKEEYYFLVEEMSNTFVAFFDWNYTFSVNINVECEYFSEYVLVRYFADADIEQSDFEKILSEKAPVFLTFLKDPQIFMKDFLQKKSQNRNSKSLTNDIDIYRKVNSLRTGIASRLILDSADWGVEETKQLLKAISENPNNNIAIEFNSYVINQSDFLSFGTKKFIAGRDISLKK